MKIVTSKWELTAFLNVTYFNNQYTKLKTYITLAENYCKIFNEQFNSTGPYCAMIHGNIKDFLAQIEKNKLLTLDSVGHGKRDKRAIFPTIVKTAKVIYGLCDVNCLWNSFLNLKKFRESGSNELKLQDKRIKIIEVKKNRDEEKAKPGLESIHELKKITSTDEVKGQILEHLINIKVLLDQYTFEILKKGSNFIELCHCKPCLWKISSVEYKNKNLRSVPYNELMEMLKSKGLASASVKEVKSKIQNIRRMVRKERAKVEASRKSGKGTDDLYTPTLWCYDLLSFANDMDPFPSIDNLGGTSDYSHEIDGENDCNNLDLTENNSQCCEQDVDSDISNTNDGQNHVSFFNKLKMKTRFNC
ncbi:hypothetical protein QTP88_007905 [Uroleucon formosanum]